MNCLKTRHIFVLKLLAVINNLASYFIPESQCLSLGEGAVPHAAVPPPRSSRRAPARSFPCRAAQGPASLPAPELGGLWGLCQACGCLWVRWVGAHRLLEWAFAGGIT